MASQKKERKAAALLSKGARIHPPRESQLALYHCKLKRLLLLLPWVVPLPLVLRPLIRSKRAAAPFLHQVGQVWNHLLLVLLLLDKEEWLHL